MNLQERCHYLIFYSCGCFLGSFLSECSIALWLRALTLGLSLVVLRLRLCPPSSGKTASISGQGLNPTCHNKDQRYGATTKTWGSKISNFFFFFKKRALILKHWFIHLSEITTLTLESNNMWWKHLPRALAVIKWECKVSHWYPMLCNCSCFFLSILFLPPYIFISPLQFSFLLLFYIHLFPLALSILSRHTYWILTIFSSIAYFTDKRRMSSWAVNSSPSSIIFTLCHSS